MVEKIITWGDLGFANGKHKDEPIPNFSWGDLSESDIATTQREDLTRDEALMILDHWFDVNGDACFGPKHPLRRIVLSLRSNSPYMPIINGNSWITIERHDTGKIIAVVRDIESSISLSFQQGAMHKEVRTQNTCLGSFTLRDAQGATA